MQTKSFDIDQYDPNHHVGELPVRVLPNTYIHWFLNIYPLFSEDFKTEVESFGLKNYLSYIIDKNPIRNVAELTINKKITVFENFNQFLWNINYSLVVVYDEGFLRPVRDGIYQGNVVSNELVDEAMALFFYAMSLLGEYKTWPDYNLPNPEKYSINRKQYVEKCNGSFVASMTFILLHEFAHQYYGHLDYFATTDDESKKLEMVADDYAFESMSKQFEGEKGPTMKLGIIVGLASLILLDSSLKGEKSHPDPDTRLRRIIEKMGLGETDNFWGIASLVFILWGNYYHKEIELPKIMDDTKTLFYKILDEVSMLKL